MNLLIGTLLVATLTAGVPAALEPGQGPQAPARRDTVVPVAAETVARRTPARPDSITNTKPAPVGPVATPVPVVMIVVLVLFGLAMAAMGRGFFMAMQGDEAIAVESRWGGFGGGGGGWRVSRPLAYLVALMFFAGMVAVMAMSALPGEQTRGTKQGGDTGATAAGDRASSASEGEE